MRRRLVLVVAPARLCASWAGDWSLSYELRSISARFNLVVTRTRMLCLPHARQAKSVSLKGNAARHHRDVLLAEEPLYEQF